MLKQSFQNIDTDIIRNIVTCTYSQIISNSYALNEILIIKIPNNLHKAQITVLTAKNNRKQSAKERRVPLLQAKKCLNY